MLKPMIRQLRRWLSATALLLVAEGALCAATDWPWVTRAWQTGEGLPDNLVASIGQTSNGFLWVATFSGLARFDGARLQTFSPAASPDMASGKITAMLLDRADRLWLAKGRTGANGVGTTPARLRRHGGRGELTGRPGPGLTVTIVVRLAATRDGAGQ